MNGGPVAPEKNFAIALDREGDAARLKLSGTLGLLARQELEEKLLEADDERVRSMILDLRGLTDGDPADLAKMLEQWVRSPRQELELILLRVPCRMRRALEEAGLDRSLPISYDSPGPFLGRQNGRV
jgi:anti-anti-sigma factor